MKTYHKPAHGLGLHASGPAFVFPLASCLLLIAALLTPLVGDATAARPKENAAPLPPGPNLQPDYGAFPLLFVENRGQSDARISFTTLGGPNAVFFAPTGVTYALVETPPAANWPAQARASSEPLRNPPNQRRWAIKLDFVGANPHAQPTGEEPAATVVSYFRGQPEEWHTGLPTFQRIVYRDLWPGIDLAYFGQAGILKYEFVVHPGADPTQIRLAYRGADVALNSAGQIEATTPAGRLTDDVPLAWQGERGDRTPVTAAFDMRPGSSGFGFRLGPYDPAQTLVIDPLILIYCGYIGGYGSDSGSAVAVDRAGNAYVTGSAQSQEDSFPVAAGPDLTFNGGDTDAFVAKINPSGTGLAYLGYIGGADTDNGYDIAVDSAGNAYVTGETWSSEVSFPDKGGPDRSFNGVRDAFVAKIDPGGTNLVYCGYVGGAGYDTAFGIALDAAANAYIVGYTDSDEATFPVKSGPDLTFNGYFDAFVTKISADGASIIYAGYIGGGKWKQGEGDDRALAVGVDGAGNAYVTGWTTSNETSFPVAVGPDVTFNIAPGCGNCSDAFVAKVNAAGTGLIYAGYIGGWWSDDGAAIAVDAEGSAYVTGYTESDQATFPVRGGPDLTFNGTDHDFTDAFVAKVDPSGNALIYAGYVGGSRWDNGSGIDVGSDGTAYVVGQTGSDQATFPVKGELDSTFNGESDAFVAAVAPSGDSLTYAGYIGGAATDSASGVALDRGGAVYVVGSTLSDSATFPVAAGPDLTFNFQDDAFVAKIGPGTRALARYAAGLPTVDGNTAEWQSLGPTVLDRSTAATITGSETNPSPADLSAALRMVWTTDALYFAANISDDVLVGNNSAQIWGDDALELSLRAGNTTHQFTLALDGRMTDQGSPITSLTAVTRTIAGGWSLEVMVPAAALGLPRFRAGQEYPFTFGLWDDDLRTYPGQTHMIWRGTSTSTYAPDWDVLRLGNETYAFWAQEPSPTPTGTATVTPSPTASPTQTGTATEMATATPSPTASSTPAGTPTGTVTPRATYTAIPASRVFLPLILR